MHTKRNKYQLIFWRRLISKQCKFTKMLYKKWFMFSGHSAKYGSYTLMDLNNNNVIDIQLVQVSDCMTAVLHH